LQRREIALPPNFNLCATMNTADESIYPMDSAFKRRWSWVFVENQMDTAGRIANTVVRVSNVDSEIDGFYSWKELVERINVEILKNSHGNRGLDDKQIGYWFARGRRTKGSGTYQIEWATLKPKLFLFLWDNVFARNRNPLLELCDSENPKTLGQFLKADAVFLRSLGLNTRKPLTGNGTLSAPPASSLGNTAEAGG
jgi:5-methylcytosine-specific restriction endonuclease McrBC GTP-binding regulatory subunit McrB